MLSSVIVAPDGDVFTIAEPNAGGATVGADVGAIVATGVDCTGADADRTEGDFCIASKIRHPTTPTSNRAAVPARRAIHFLECSWDRIRFALRVFGDGTESIFATSLTVCGRRSGFFARQARTTSSHAASIGSPSISSSLRRCVIGGGILSRICRSTFPE